MKLIIGNDNQKPEMTRQLAELCKQDPDGLFVTRDQNGANQLKQDHPEIAGKIFFASTLEHARGRQERNIYVDQLLHSQLNTTEAQYYNIVAATMVADDVEHVSASSGVQTTPGHEDGSSPYAEPEPYYHAEPAAEPTPFETEPVAETHPSDYSVEHPAEHPAEGTEHEAHPVGA